MCQMNLVFGKSRHRCTKGESHLTNLIAFCDKLTFFGWCGTSTGHCLHGFLQDLQCGFPLPFPKETDALWSNGLCCGQGVDQKHPQGARKHLLYKLSTCHKCCLPGINTEPQSVWSVHFGWDQMYLDGICWQIQRGRGHFSRECHPVGRPG